MAFTIYQQPDKYTPAYNDILFYVGGSSNISEPNYKYVFKIYINGSTTPIIKKIFPHPTYSTALLNIGRMIESYVKHDIDTSVYGFQVCSNSITKYRVDFYEEFDIDGVPTLSEVLETSADFYAWNSILDFLSFQSYSSNNYAINNSKILNHELKRNVTLNDSGYIYCLTKDQDDGYISYIEINTYNNTNTLLQTASFPNPYTDLSNYKNSLIAFDCAPKGINNIPAFYPEVIITNEVKTYTVSIFWNDTVDDEIINIKTLNFNVVDYCNEYFRLHYLNNLGAFESFNFAFRSKHTETIKRESYKGVVGTFGETTYGYSKSDKSTFTNYTQIQDTYKVRSEWLSEEYQNILEQLVSSPCVYLDTNSLNSSHPLYNNGLLAIDIKNTNFEFETKKVKKMLSLELDFDLSFNRYRQRN